MGKRSDFDRIEKDHYRTIDPNAVIPFPKYSNDPKTYYEPCCGDGSLINLLNDHTDLKCIGASDIEDYGFGYEVKDVFDIKDTKADFFITNPPWDRKLLHPIIEHLSSIKPTWLLFDADWMHTKQSIPYIKYCRSIISLGRLKWFRNEKTGKYMSGKDNCCWYLFDQDFSLFGLDCPIFTPRK